MISFIVISVNLILAVGLYFSLQFNWWVAINVILFLAWLLSLNFFSGRILFKIFPLPNVYTGLLALFLNIFLLGFIANIFTSWLALNDLSFLASLIITGLLLFFWSYKFEHIAGKPKIYLADNEGYWHFKNWLAPVFLILVVMGFAAIFLSRTGDYLNTPWQVLPSWYLLVISFLFLMAFALIFSRKKVWLILVSIIIVSFLIHSYLLVYAEGFGGDRWRHLGSENRILSEMVYQPTLLSDDIWYQNVLGVNLPRALIAGPKISYGFEWSLVIIMAKISKLSVFLLDQYLILFLWSLFVPLISFVLAYQIKEKRNQALLASGLTLVFYLLQYYGGQTLPLSFSVLYFLFLIAGFLAYLKNKQKTILFFLGFLTALSYFGYSLAFIILILSFIWLLAVNLKPFQKYFIFLILSLLLLSVEALTGFSYLAGGFSWAKTINGLISGNFLFFARGEFLIFPFKYVTILSLFISLIVGGLFLFSVIKMLKTKKDHLVFLSGLSIILIINYLGSWVFLEGLHTLSRRMSVYMVLLLIFVLAYGLSNLINNKSKSVAAVIIISLVGVLTYASGPVLEASVTSDDVASMKYVWGQINNEPGSYCILADTWPLLALEAYSAKEIVAGNFSSDFNYQQPERVSLFNNFIKSPSLNIINNAIQLTKTKSCFIVINYNLLDKEKIRQINYLLLEPKIFGQNLIWQYK